MAHSKENKTHKSNEIIVMTFLFYCCQATTEFVVTLLHTRTLCNLIGGELWHNGPLGTDMQKAPPRPNTLILVILRLSCVTLFF